MKYIRLKFIAKQINKDERVLDVGTDHGLLPIILVKDGITKNVVASDLNKEPLNAAIENIENDGLTSVIKTELMNGIEGIDENQYDTIIIAGMGGITISEIIKSKKHNGRFIIHSTTNLIEVREALQDIGFEITNEWVVFEGKIHNVIIEAKQGKMILDDKLKFMGPMLITKNDEQTLNYYEHLYNVYERNSKLSGDEELKINERRWLKEKLWNEKN